MEIIEIIRSHALALPPLGKFPLGMVLIFGIPPLARRIRLPAVVGLMLSGIVFGPHVLGAFGEDRPIADFSCELGEAVVDVCCRSRDGPGSLSADTEQINHIWSYHRQRSFTARRRGWTLIWLRTHRSYRSGIAARIAYTPRISGRG